MAEIAVREYLQDNTNLLDDIKKSINLSNTRLSSVVDILTVQSNSLAKQIREDRIARENLEFNQNEASREAARAQSSASATMETGGGASIGLETSTRGGLLKGLITAGMLGVLGTAAYRYFGLGDFKDELASSDAYNTFKTKVGSTFDNLIFGDEQAPGERSGGLVGTIADSPVASAAAGAGLVAFLMKGARFRALPAAMATFMLGYIGLNAFFNPDANQEVADSIDEGINDLENNFDTEFFNILRDKFGVNVTGEGVVNVLGTAAVYKGTSLALRLFGAGGRGKFLIPLAGAMAYFAFNYFGLDNFFAPDNEDEIFDFLESETLAEYGALIASALAMGTVALTPAALAAGAAAAGKSKAPTGPKALKPRLLGSKGLLIASAATAIAAYTFNRLGIPDLFSSDEEDTDALEKQTDDAFTNLLDSAAIAGGAALALQAARTPITRRGYTFDRKMKQYRIAPGNPNAGRFASAAEAAKFVFDKYPRISRLAKGIPLIGTALTAGGAYFILADDNLSEAEKVSMIGGLLGGLATSVILGAIGSFIVPGFGTIAGGLIGYIGGEYATTKLLLWALGADENETAADLNRAVLSAKAKQQAQIQKANEFFNSQGGRIGNDSLRPLGSGKDQGPSDGLGVTIPYGDEISALDEFAQQFPMAIPRSSLMGPESARQAAENYLGRPMSDTEYSALLRAVYAEASGETGGDFTTEKAMIMASILNRARGGYDHPEGSVIGALLARNQFQAVTGTASNPGPSQMFMDGPGAGSLADIEAATSLLKGISRAQKNFTAAASGAYGPGTNIGYRDNMISGGGTTIGGSVFNTKPTLTPSALELGSLSGQLNMPITTVVNNIDNSQNIEGGGSGSGSSKAPSSRVVARDTSYSSAAMSMYG